MLYLQVLWVAGPPEAGTAYFLGPSCLATILCHFLVVKLWSYSIFGEAPTLVAAGSCFPHYELEMRSTAPVVCEALQNTNFPEDA